MSTSTSCNLSEIMPPLAKVPQPAVQHLVPSGITLPTEQKVGLILDLFTQLRTLVQTGKIGMLTRRQFKPLVLELQHAHIVLERVAVVVWMFGYRCGSELLFMLINTKVRVLPSHRLDRVGTIAAMRSRHNGLLLCVEHESL